MGFLQELPLVPAGTGRYNGGLEATRKKMGQSTPSLPFPTKDFYVIKLILLTDLHYQFQQDQKGKL